MRGEGEKQQNMFSYISPEQRVRVDHPLLAVRDMMDQILKEMSPRFARLYSDVGRPSTWARAFVVGSAAADLLYHTLSACWSSN